MFNSLITRNSVVSVVHPGNSSGECRLQVPSSARVAEFEWENSSEIPIERLFVAISTRERGQLSNFTEVREGFGVNDTMETIVHKKGVIEAYKLDSEACLELQRTYNRTLGLEIQSCLRIFELRSRLEKKLSWIENEWPEDEDGVGTVTVRRIIMSANWTPN